MSASLKLKAQIISCKNSSTQYNDSRDIFIKLQNKKKQEKI